MALNTKNLVYGFGAMGILTMENDVVGFSNITGSFSANIAGEDMPVMGGATNYAVATARGRADGAISISLNECPAFIEKVANGMVETSVSANDFTLSDVNGSIKDKLTAAAKSSSVPVAGSYMIRVVSATSVEVTALIGTGMVETETVTGLDETNPKDVGSLNVTLILSGADSLKDTDIGASAVLTIAHSSDNAVIYTQPSVHKTVYSRLIFSTSLGSTSHDVRIHDFYKVTLNRIAVAGTSKELPTHELTGIINDPMTGTGPYKEIVLVDPPGS